MEKFKGNQNYLKGDMLSQKLHLTMMFEKMMEEYVQWEVYGIAFKIDDDFFSSFRFKSREKAVLVC